MAWIDLAQDLMELIFEGPEEDVIWSAFNDGDNGSKPVAVADDDEETEARALAFQEQG